MILRLVAICCLVGHSGIATIHPGTVCDNDPFSNILTKLCDQSSTHINAFASTTIFVPKFETKDVMSLDNSDVRAGSHLMKFYV